MKASFRGIIGAAVAAAVVAAPLAADDKAILQAAGGHAQALVMLDSSFTSGTRIDDASLSGAANTFGGADSPDSKMKIAKNVLLQFLNPLPPGNTEWSLATFSRGNKNATISGKEFVYEQGPNTGGCDFACNKAYAQVDGVWERWGNYGWPTDPDPRSITAPSGVTYTNSRTFCSNFGQYPTGGETAVIPLNASGAGYATCAAAGTTYPARILMTWQTTNHYHLKACESGSAGGPCPAGVNNTNNANNVVVLTKVHQLRNGNSQNWQAADDTATTTYTYVSGFVSEGNHSGVAVNAAGSTASDTTQIDTPSGTNCGAWETGPNSAPSSPFWPPTDTGCQTLLNNELQNVSDIVDINPTTKAIINASTYNCSGVATTEDSNFVVFPNGKECVDNSIGKKSAASYFQSLCTDACAKRYLIFITDDLQANQQTDPCSGSHATGDLSASGQGTCNGLQLPGVQVLTIYLGTKAAANAGQGWWKCLPDTTAVPTNHPIAPPGWFIATDGTELLETLTAIAALIDQNTKDFASATVSSVQTGTDQIALLATFNASSTRTLWNGRVKSYRLRDNTDVASDVANNVANPQAAGILDTTHTGTRYEIDPITKGTITLTGLPSSDPSFLMWSSGANLEAISATTAMATLGANAALTTGTYQDDSNVNLTTIPTYTWPGRKMFFSVEQTTAATFPETRVDLASSGSPGGAPWTNANTFPSDPGSCASYFASGCSWYWLKYYYLGLTATDESGSNTKADQDIHFVRGDHNTVVTWLGTDPGVCLFGAAPSPDTGTCVRQSTTCACPAANSPYLYNDYATPIDSSGSAGAAVLLGEYKLGDIFHSNPTLMGRPNNVIYYNLGLNPDGTTGHDYVSFYKRLRRRRQVMFAGANDGFLHAFDIGAFRRGQNITTCPNGTDAITGDNPDHSANPLGGCYDLGLGTEIFAYAPRATMSSFDQLAHDASFQGFPEEWTADGLTTADDMFLSNASTNLSTRNWHSILVGSLREGARKFSQSGISGFRGSYFALDVTQPDSLPTFDPSHPDPNSSPAYDGLSTTDSHKSPQCIAATAADPVQSTTTAGCAAGSNGKAVEYPRVLWEFNDTATNGIPSDGSDGLAVNLPTDSDGSSDPGKGYPDLGETWSKPVLGRIELPLNSANPNNQHTCVADNTKQCEDKYVAIFGGGFDSEKKNRRGNWLYVIDVETGSVLFKANSGVNSTGTTIPFGAMPAQPLAIDYTFDGYLDVVYIGDLNGRMWRMFIGGNPNTVNFNATASPLRTSNKITISGSGVTRPWQPFLFFNDPRAAALILPATSNVCGGVTPAYNYCNALSITCSTKPCPITGTTQGPPRSIYYAASPVYISTASNGQPILGIAFSTGERDDIRGTATGNNSAPASNYQTYRFYYVIDDPTSPSTTYTESSLTAISPTVNTTDSSLVFPTSCSIGSHGWYINMPGNGYTDSSSVAMVGERGISEIVAVAGYIYWTTFIPNKPGNVTVPIPGDTTGGTTTLCSQAGIARLYRVYYSYCNGGSVDAVSTKIGDFASNPIAYVDENGVIHVIDATENGTVPQDPHTQAVSSRIKNWKEQ